jgi:hypothetical protein
MERVPVRVLPGTLVVSDNGDLYGTVADLEVRRYGGADVKG